MSSYAPDRLGPLISERRQKLVDFRCSAAIALKLVGGRVSGIEMAATIAQLVAAGLSVGRPWRVSTRASTDMPGRSRAASGWTGSTLLHIWMRYGTLPTLPMALSTFTAANSGPAPAPACRRGLASGRGRPRTWEGVALAGR